MTAPINTDYTFQYSEAQAILQDYDFNNDNQITSADYWKYRSEMEEYRKAHNGADNPNQIEFTAEEIKAWEVIFLVENEENSNADNITQDNANSFFQNKLGTLPDPDTATTLRELQQIGKDLTKYIRNCTELVETFDEMIVAHQVTLNQLAKEKEAEEAKYEEIAEDVEKKEKELSAQIKNALGIESSTSEKYKEDYERVFNKTMEDYKNGELGDTPLYKALSDRLRNVGFAVGPLNRAISKYTETGKKIMDLCSDLNTLTASIRDINTRYNTENNLCNTTISNRTRAIELGKTATKNYEKGYQRRLDMRQEIIDKYHVISTVKKNNNKNEQVQMLEKFLADGMLETMTLNDAWAIIKVAFDTSGIVLKDDGSMVVPKKRGSDSREVYNVFVEKMKELFGIDKVTRLEEADDDGLDGGNEQFDDGNGNVGAGGGAGKAKRNDPIGFEQDNITYNFVIDRDKDGTFDDASELLGAKNGWAEVKAFDLDGNGIIEGDELENMTLLAIDNETGQYTFMNAQEAGVESIDLKSYKRQNSRQVNNNVLAGTFNINVNGETLQGKQTFDSLRNLNNEFSMMYGSNIADLSDKYKENPFMEEFVEKVNTHQVNSRANNNISSASTKIDRNLNSTARETELRANTRMEEEQNAIDRENERLRLIEEVKEAEKKQELEEEEQNK